MLRIFWNFHNSISNFITNQITSCFCCFLNCFFLAVLKASVVDCLAWSGNFLSVLTAHVFNDIFTYDIWLIWFHLVRFQIYYLLLLVQVLSVTFEIKISNLLVAFVYELVFWVAYGSRPYLKYLKVLCNSFPLFSFWKHFTFKSIKSFLCSIRKYNSKLIVVDVFFFFDWFFWFRRFFKNIIIIF